MKSVDVRVEHSPRTLKCLRGSFDLVQKHTIKWILKEPYKSYSDEEFLTNKRKLDLLPIKFKFLLEDLLLFFKIVNNKVNIKLPNYVSRIEPHDVKKIIITRSSKATAEGSDKSKFKCKLVPI